MHAQGQQYVISTYAGLPSATLPISALRTAIGSPQSIATDRVGNVYFTSLNPDSPVYYHGRCGVFKLDGNGVLTRIAGNTGEGFSGDGGPAVNATFRLSNFDDEPGLPGILVDDGGGVYIADSGNNRVRLLSPDGTIITIAGNGDSGNSGDGGPPPNAQLAHPSSLANYASNLYIYIVSGNSIRRLTPGTITTIASAAPGSVVATDSADNLYIAGGGSVRKLAPSGDIATIAAEDGAAIAVDRSGYVFLAQGARVREITPAGQIVTVAGNGSCGYSGDGGPATGAQVCVNGLAIDRDGNIYLAEAQSQRIRKISPDGIISTVAGNGDCCYSGDGGPAIGAQLNLAPWGGGMTVDHAGNVYIADAANQRVRKISQSGIVTTVAGNGISNGYSGDGGPATSAQLNYPSEVVVDSQGNLYIADVGNQRVRKVTPDGIISTVVEAYGRALAVDSADALYFADGGGVHKIANSGTLTTITTTPLNSPFAAAVDNAGNYYAAEIGSQLYRVRKITQGGVITTVAGGDGTAGYSGDGGVAAIAQLKGPVALATDDTSNLYIADTFNGRIRMVSPSGIITTIAGNGGSGYSGDGGLATNAQFGQLSGLTIDSRGNLYAADEYYNTIRLLQPLGSAPVISGVANAASYVSGTIAPGELVILSGYGLGPEQIASGTPGSDGVYPTQLAGTTVMVNGMPASLIYSTPTQVAAVIPGTVRPGTAAVTVTYQGQTSSPLNVPVVDSSPGIFTVDSSGRGDAVTINQNGSIDAPVEWGDTISFFATGVGSAASAAVVFYPDSSLQLVFPLSIGKGQTDSAGVTQIGLQIPFGPLCGVPMRLQIGNAASQAGPLLAMDPCF